MISCFNNISMQLSFLVFVSYIKFLSSNSFFLPSLLQFCVCVCVLFLKGKKQRKCALFIFPALCWVLEQQFYFSEESVDPTSLQSEEIEKKHCNYLLSCNPNGRKFFISFLCWLRKLCHIQKYILHFHVTKNLSCPLRLSSVPSWCLLEIQSYCSKSSKPVVF